MPRETLLLLLLITLFGVGLPVSPAAASADSHTCQAPEVSAGHAEDQLPLSPGTPLTYGLAACWIGEVGMDEARALMPCLKETQVPVVTARPVSARASTRAYAASPPRHLLYGVFLT